MDLSYDEIASHLLQDFKNNKRVFIAISGIPGSGKSTTAETVAQIINSRVPNTAIVVPMDGYHLYKKQLDQLPDPAEAYRRRGAPFTFYPQGLLNLLRLLKSNESGKAPSFDHKVGDPVEDDIIIQPSHKIIIVEGIYIMIDEPIWKDIAAEFDQRYWLDVPIDEAMERVVRRHIGTGLTEAQARARVAGNDRPNAEWILQHRLPTDSLLRPKHNKK